MQRKQIWPCVAVGNTTSWDWMRANSSRIVRGEFPSAFDRLGIVVPKRMRLAAPEWQTLARIA